MRKSCLHLFPTATLVSSNTTTTVSRRRGKFSRNNHRRPHFSFQHWSFQFSLLRIPLAPIMDKCIERSKLNETPSVPSENLQLPMEVKVGHSVESTVDSGQVAGPKSRRKSRVPKKRALAVSGTKNSAESTNQSDAPSQDNTQAEINPNSQTAEGQEGSVDAADKSTNAQTSSSASKSRRKSRVPKKRALAVPVSQNISTASTTQSESDTRSQDNTQAEINPNSLTVEEQEGQISSQVSTQRPTRKRGKNFPPALSTSVTTSTAKRAKATREQPHLARTTIRIASSDEDADEPVTGKQLQIPSKLKVLRRSKLYVPTSSEDEDLVCARPDFYVTGNLHHGYCIPNQYSKRAFKKLTPDEKEKIRGMNVTLHYPEFLDYYAVNDQLLLMYKLYKKFKNACCICMHFGFGITRFAHEPIHEFYDFDRFKTHWKGYHCQPRKCEVCRMLFKDARGLKGHSESMKARKDAKGRKHREFYKRTQELIEESEVSSEECSDTTNSDQAEGFQRKQKRQR